jgi:hypothetical protein
MNRRFHYWNFAGTFRARSNGRCKDSPRRFARWYGFEAEFGS